LRRRSEGGQGRCWRGSRIDKCMEWWRRGVMKIERPTSPRDTSNVDAASAGGFAEAEDYVLFGLLAAHGLMRPEHFALLAQMQQQEPAGTSLLDMLARSSDLPPKTRADVEELLRILQTPKL